MAEAHQILTAMKSCRAKNLSSMPPPPMSPTKILKIRAVTRKFPVGLHCEWKTKTSGAYSHPCPGRITSEAVGKQCAKIVHMLGGPEVPVDMKQLIFPLHKVGSMVQVVDKHSLQGENHGKKYWYDATVTAVISRGKTNVPDYIVVPTNPNEKEAQQVKGVDVRDHCWKAHNGILVSDGPNGPTYYEKKLLETDKKKKEQQAQKTKEQKEKELAAGQNLLDLFGADSAEDEDPKTDTAETAAIPKTVTIVIPTSKLTTTTK